MPSWSAVTAGQRPPIMEVEDREPGVPGQGVAACSCNQDRVQFRDILMPRMSPMEQALLRSQSGPCAGVAFSVCPSSPLTRIDSALFRVLLQRRLHLPLSLSHRICGCGRPLDPFCHHHAACSRTEAPGRRASLWRVRPQKSSGTCLCETWTWGLPVAGDNRRLEVVVDGLPLHGGVDGPRGQGSLGGSRSGGGKWSAEVKSFVGQRAKARARSEPRVLQRRMEQAWRLRWLPFFSLVLKGTIGADGHAPMPHEVECDHCFRGFGQNPTILFDTLMSDVSSHFAQKKKKRRMATWLAEYQTSFGSDHFRETVALAQSHASDQAHLRSHSGPGAGAVLHGAPTGQEFQVQPILFHTLILERLRLRLLLTEAMCEWDRTTCWEDIVQHVHSLAG